MPDSPTCSYAQLLGVPLVLSYHTHLPSYCYKYWKHIGPILAWVSWNLLCWPVNHADLTLVMSSAIKVSNGRKDA